MRALLWDMNGVLVDDEPLQEEAWIAALSSAGIQLEDGWWQEHFLGRRVSETMEKLFGFTPDDYAGLLVNKTRHYSKAAASGLPTGPGAVEMLHAAQTQGIKQALVTSAGPMTMDMILDHLNVREFFEALICGRDVERGKPAPDGFLLGAERLGVAPEDCWVIEDSIPGLQAAHAAGMRCVAITTSFPAIALADAEIIVDTLSTDLLGRL